jgi:hypothetical protein
MRFADEYWKISIMPVPELVTPIKLRLDNALVKVMSSPSTTHIV